MNGFQTRLSEWNERERAFIPIFCVHFVVTCVHNIQLCAFVYIYIGTEETRERNSKNNKYQQSNFLVC